MDASKLIKGAVAGFTATGPMTAFMLAAHRLLPGWERYPLPPEQITTKAARKNGLGKRLDKPARLELTLLSHLAYGTLSGSIYNSFASKMPLPRFVRGGVFGVVLWAVGYLGWIPAFGILPTATKHPLRRNGLMIIAHIVWGVWTDLMLGRPKAAPADQQTTTTTIDSQVKIKML